MPQRKRKKTSGRKAAAYERAVAILDEERVKQIRQDWDTWDTGQGGKE
ncbi:hypothetical protein PC119_g15542 [Phytophthora cactorum]|nr:hypothetical protein PC114_g19829 [Phytophthora cactorum]KAG3004679.1 hypothetical protein PC119_g15542 [Phytophthora cactorum]KAG3162684.1 hypothetical protein PC128_g20544 [Phytophthora cactorum]KAG4043832.1 hypothetical protein PC123_g20708 [Phytophthora cactorum]